MEIQNYYPLNCVCTSAASLPVRYKITKIFFTLLFSFYLALSLIRFNWPARLWMSSIITSLGLFAFMFLSIRIRRKYVPIYLFVGFIIAAFLVSSLFVSRTERIGHVVLFILFNAGIAMILLRGYVYSWGGYIVFYGLVGYFLTLILTGVSPRNALICSHNGISTMMLVACVSLYIILSMEHKKIDLKPALLTLLISIWAIGRSGIISCLVLFLGILYVRLHAKQKYVHIGIISLIIFFILSYVFFDVLYSWFMNFSYFQNAIDNHLARIMDPRPSERLVMWKNYYNNLDIPRVIFGVNVHTDPWPDKERLAYNYHNSFINLHLQTGFMGLITVALIILSFFKFYKNNQVFFFLLLAICIRWSTDIGLFFESWDFVLLFFIFYYLRDIFSKVPHSQYRRYRINSLGKLDIDLGRKASSQI